MHARRVCGTRRTRRHRSRAVRGPVSLGRACSSKCFAAGGTETIDQGFVRDGESETAEEGSKTIVIQIKKQNIGHRATESTEERAHSAYLCALCGSVANSAVYILPAPI